MEEPRKIDLGFTTADGEQVRWEFDGENLVLRFVDWKENPVRYVFRDLLALRWGQEVGMEGVRDDEAYEIVGSAWAVREAELAGVESSSYTHVKLCFNAEGVLDLVCRRTW